MKTLVTTLRYGDCDWFPKFVPTLDAWCERHRHELDVWDDPRLWQGYPCPKFCEREMLDVFLGSKYDRIIYIDADVWIHPDAPDFPVLPGLALATDEHHLKHNMHFAGWCAALYGTEFPLWEYRNAGVWSIDRGAAKLFLDKWKLPFVEFFQEQHYFNAAAARAQADGMTLSRLPIIWNSWSDDNRPAWFQHFWGLVAKEPDAEILTKLKP